MGLGASALEETEGVMMAPRQFNSLGAFASHLMKQNLAVAVALQAGCEAIGRAVEKTAKSEFGTYQPDVGPFPKWAELADSTKDERVRQGYTENDPLLRSGELRDSISHSSEILEAVIGSTSPLMPYHEFGTGTIPPRPVLGPAAQRNKAKIQAIAAGALINGIAGAEISGLFGGGKMIHPSLGYNFTV